MIFYFKETIMFYDRDWEIEQIELAINYFEQRRQHNGILADAALQQLELLTQRLDDLKAESNLGINREQWQTLAWVGHA
jgi:hypothetical protein